MPKARFLLFAGCLLFSAAVPTGAVGFENHRIVARRAIDILPPPIAPLFAANRQMFVERAVEPFAAWPRDLQMRKRRNWHWVGLDLEVVEQDRLARLKAAGRFSRTEARAKKAYRKNHVRGGGVLPWAVENLYNDLVRALREGREEDILRAAGYLTHFAGCCASPFSATCHRDGRTTKNLCFGSLEIGDDLFAHQDVQHRFDIELARRNSGRYQERVVLGLADYDPVSEPVGRAFEVLLDSLGCLDAVLAADREILVKLKAVDAEQFATRADEFYVLLDERCGELCVERLRAGAILAGSLIGGAWEQAGKPSVEEIRSRGVPSLPAAAPSDAGDAAPKTEDAGTFVGSKNSKVFHRLDCSHAGRISPKNLVTFETAEDALEQGRRPCRVCNPQ